MTAWSVSRRRSTRGFTHSSSTIRTGLPGGERFDQTLLGQGEKTCRLLALHTGEIGEKGVQSVAFRDVVEKGFDRHTRAGKARGAVHHVRIHADDFIESQFLRAAHFFFLRIGQTLSSLQALWRGMECGGSSYRLPPSVYTANVPNGWRMKGGGCCHRTPRCFAHFHLC